MIGDFNGWDPRANPMRGSDAGIWTVKVPEAKQGSLYKYHVVSKDGNHRADKADPYAFRCEMPPRTGSMVWKLDYEWGDAEWMKTARARQRARRAVVGLRAAPRLVAARPFRSAAHPVGYARSPRCWPTT